MITRGDKSKDRGSPIPAGISGIAKIVGGDVNIVDIVGQNGEKLARFMHNDTIKVSDNPKSISKYNYINTRCCWSERNGSRTPSIFFTKSN